MVEMKNVMIRIVFLLAEMKNIVAIRITKFLYIARM